MGPAVVRGAAVMNSRPAGALACTDATDETNFNADLQESFKRNIQGTTFDTQNLRRQAFIAVTWSSQVLESARSTAR